MTKDFAQALIGDFIKSPDATKELLPLQNTPPRAYVDEELYSGYRPAFSCGMRNLALSDVFGFYSLSTYYFRRLLYGLFPKFSYDRGFSMRRGMVTRGESGTPYIKNHNTSTRTRVTNPETGLNERGMLLPEGLWTKKVWQPIIGAEEKVNLNFNDVVVLPGDGVYYLGKIIGDDNIIDSLGVGNNLMEHAIPNSELAFNVVNGYQQISTKTTDPGFWYITNSFGEETYQVFSQAEDGVGATIVLSPSENVSDISSLLQKGVVLYTENWMCDVGVILWQVNGNRWSIPFNNICPISGLRQYEMSRYEYIKSAKSSEDIKTFSDVIRQTCPSMGDCTRLLESGMIPEPSIIISRHKIDRFSVSLRRGCTYHVYLSLHNYLKTNVLSSLTYRSVKCLWSPPKMR